jgi:hypothetical protein
METEEVWCVIDEFPNYEVSSTGLVMNSSTNRIMKTSKTTQGVIKVGLMGFDGKQHTRSVKVLVADAFVGGRDDICDTPISLDGDQTNCNAYNLVWRPRWFAWKYSTQPMYRYYTINPVCEVLDSEPYGQVYTNIQEASIVNGLLMKDILSSCHKGDPCFPTGQYFAYANATHHIQ